MKRAAIIIVAAVLASGCTATSPRLAGKMNPILNPEITYETGPCFGRCPVYRVTVRNDGTGQFIGIRNTAVTGTRDFLLTGTQYRAFAEALDPYRPHGEKLYRPGTSLCPHAVTDLPSVDVHWDAGKVHDHLYYYYGCNRNGSQTMADAIGNAPDVLPIEDLVGPQP